MGSCIVPGLGLNWAKVDVRTSSGSPTMAWSPWSAFGSISHSIPAVFAKSSLSSFASMLIPPLRLG